MIVGSYKTPQAFRAALEMRLNDAAQNQGVDLQRLRRSVAFERLLARLFSPPDPPWLLKGGYALELRLQEPARSTLDMDLSVPNPGHLSDPAEQSTNAIHVMTVYAHLQQIAGQDLEDGFEFLIERPRQDPIKSPYGGIRCSVSTRVAGRIFERFPLDIGLGDAVVEAPEWVEGNTLLEFAGIRPAQVALYPITQQIAEKIHAYTFPWQDRDNTRVKDLVDLVLLVRLEQLEPERIKRALQATFKTRDTHPLPDRLPTPPLEWEEPYAALAEELGLPIQTSTEAYAYLAIQWRMWIQE